MIKKITIRDMGLSDVEMVLTHGSKEPTFRNLSGNEIFWDRDVLENWVKSQGDIAIVAEYDKELAGFLLATYSPTNYKGTFENSYVLPNYRRLSIATEMYQELERRMRKRGARLLCGFPEIANTPSLRML